MYQVDHRDRLTELKNVPQSSPGVPLPVVLGDEHHLQLAYFVQENDPNYDGASSKSVSPSSQGNVAIVAFRSPRAHLFGPPNDEAFSGHPLAGRGFRPYAAFEVIDSSWIRRLTEMNSVHPNHSPRHFVSYRHFIFAFHDSTFECVAKDFTATIAWGSLNPALEKMVEMMQGK
jgi:hypothetical protein